MHPAMALWMWSMVMCRIWHATLMGKEYRPEDDFLPAKVAPLLVRANAYLIATSRTIRFLIAFSIDSRIFIGRREKPNSRSNSLAEGQDGGLACREPGSLGDV